MPQKVSTGLYSIAAVSKLTGIGCHALRVWERRYGFPVPLRAPSGHRRYAPDQVEAIANVARGLKQGQSLSSLVAQARSPGDIVAAARPERPKVSAVSRTIDRLLAGDLEGAEYTYLLAVGGLAPLDCLKVLIEPGLVEVGERWFRGECDVFQEHAASAFFRRKLSVLIEEARANNVAPRRTAVVGTVQGDRHEGGVLMLNLALELKGWRALAVGIDLPVREYQKAVDLWHPDAVCLSFVLSRNVNKRFDELAKLRGAPVYVGGRSLINYQGLARRHGLHPLVGPCEDAVRRLIAEVELGGMAEAR